MTHQAQNGFAEVGGVRLYYEREGQGPDLVFVHAGCADRRMWDAQIPIFQKSYRVLRYDMRGYGKSTLVKESFSNRNDLRHLLEFLDIPQAHFVACSIGSLTALDFALEYPEQVKSLTLVSPAVSGYQMEGPMPPLVSDLVAARQSLDLERAADLQAQIWVQGFKRAKEETDSGVYEAVRQMSLEALTLQREIIRETIFLIDEPLNPPAIHRLDQITVPTLVMAGDMDDDTVMAVTDLLATQIHSAQKVVIHAAAHLPNMEKPEEFNQIVLAFLKRAD